MSRSPEDVRYLIPLWGLAIVAFLFFLQAAASLLIPVVLGFLMSSALEPVVAWLARHRLPRTAGTTLLLVTLLGLAGWGGYGLRDEALQTIDSLPAAAARMREMVTDHVVNGAGASIRQAADELNGTADAESSDAPRDSESKNGAGGLGDMSGLLRESVQSMFALAGYVTVIFFSSSSSCYPGTTSDHVSSRSPDPMSSGGAPSPRSFTTSIRRLNGFSSCAS